MKKFPQYESKHEAGSVQLAVYKLGDLGGGDEFVILRNLTFANPTAGGYGVSHALAIRERDWPALRAAIDEMLNPKPGEHAPLYAAMSKTPR